jgi:hypothetical protein
MSDIAGSRLPSGFVKNKKNKDKYEIPDIQKPFQDITKDLERFLNELNYLIPVQLKRIGYELTKRYEEADIVDHACPWSKNWQGPSIQGILHEIRNQSLTWFRQW